MTIHLPKVNEFGGGNGGGGCSSSLPIIVKNSGSSLPSASSYSFGDKFLQTSAKKIYTPVVNGYIANSNTNLSSATIDYNTGIATGFVASQYRHGYCSRSLSSLTWSSSDNAKSYQAKFKIKDNIAGDIAIFHIGCGENGPSGQQASFCVRGGKIYHLVATVYGSSISSISLNTQILDTTLETNVVYFLKIQKTDTSCVAQLTLEDGTIVEEKTFTTTNFSTSYYNHYINYGGAIVNTGSWIESGTNIDIDLANSSGQLLIPNTSTLSWDNGTDLINNTEYADKTNEILYIYENNELLAINKPNSFAQITGQPSDNSNLARDLNNKQNKALSFTNKSASSWVADNTYTDYGYKCELSCSGVTSSMYAMVNFAPTEADSGNYATVCQTGSGTVTIYSKVNDTITIPSIVVMGV